MHKSVERRAYAYRAPTGVCFVELAALPGVRLRPLSERCQRPLELALLDAAVTDGVERLHSTTAAPINRHTTQTCNIRVSIEEIHVNYYYYYYFSSIRAGTTPRSLSLQTILATYLSIRSTYLQTAIKKTTQIYY